MEEYMKKIDPKQKNTKLTDGTNWNSLFWGFFTLYCQIILTKILISCSVQ